MAKMDVYNQEAQVVGSAELNDAVFGIEPNQQAIYDAVLTYQAGLRQGTANTLTRHYVSGTGRKPFRQKGTGRARQGSTRATQWRHGAVAFGPHPRKYNLHMNRKVRRLALRSALSEKCAAGELKLIDNLSFDEIKTKKAAAMMEAFGFDTKTMFVADGSEDFDNAYLSLRNIPNALVVSLQQLNVYDIVNADVVVFTQTAAAKAGEVYA